MLYKVLCFMVMLLVLVMFGTCSFTLYKEERDYQINKPKYPVIPKDFQDCRLGLIEIDRHTKIHAVRCPNSTVSIRYPFGKYIQETVTRDGD